MKKILFTTVMLAFIFTATAGGNTVIVSSGFSFSPASASIALGDSVTFQLANIHNAVEVSQATYNANGTQALSGGFSVPYGGGVVPPAYLPVGVHYYVCQVHASMGMKGTITVTDSPSGVNEVNDNKLSVTVYPTPVSDQATVTITGSTTELKNTLFIIYDAGGKEINRLPVPQSAPFNLSCGQLANGLYLYRLLNGSQVLADGKLVVQH